jgi:hypothetical protein
MSDTPPELSPAQQTLLQQQVFDDTQPGRILHDFHVLLAHIPREGLPSTGKYSLLPIPSIPLVDARLSRPLRLSMARPALRSHPHLAGLYLLARATGLIQVTGSGEKARLVIDQPTLERWQERTPCERYCTLLEAWWVFGKPEMVGEDRSGLTALIQALRLWQAAKTDHWNRTLAFFAGNVSYSRDLALCDLFGLLKVEIPDEPAQKWQPTSAVFTPFGDALLTLIDAHRMDVLFLDLNDPEEPDEDQEPGIHFGALQPFLQPVLPGYQNVLVIPAPEGGPDGVYIFKVSLGKVWRRIAMCHDHTLHALLCEILRAFKFDFDHLYEFRFRDARGVTVSAGDPRMEEGPAADEYALSEVLIEPGATMDLIYDFGDNWKFKVRLERIDPPGSVKKLPKLLEKKGEAPEQYPDSNWD